jgi:hypothetical protein
MHRSFVGLRGNFEEPVTLDIYEDWFESSTDDEICEFSSEDLRFLHAGRGIKLVDVLENVHMRER